MHIIKKLIPHFIVFGILVLVSFLFFAPAAFEGKVLRQGDNVQAQGMAAEIVKTFKETGHSPLWTNAAFSGMPAYHIWGVSKNKVWSRVRQMMSLNADMKAPHGLLLLAMLASYLALLLIGIDYRIAAICAIAFGLIPNNIIYTDAGHTIKLIAIFMSLPILAGAYKVFRGQYLLGLAVISFFLALQLSANHYQITYYTFILVGIMSIGFVIKYFKSDKARMVWKPIAVIALAVGIGVLSNLGKFWSTYEYAQETIRGKTYLKSSHKGGLDKSYAQSYSLGIGESFGLMFAQFRGGSSSKVSFLEDKSSETYKAFRKLSSKVPQGQMRALQRSTWSYWGASGTLHYGVVLSFLFILGLMLVGPVMRWTGIVGMVFFLMLAWGSNFSAFNNLVFDYFPMYNKFRDPKMCLQVAQALIVFIAAMGLHRYFSGDLSMEKKWRGLKKAAIGFLSLMGVLFVYSFVGDMSTASDNALSSLPELQSALQADRASWMRGGLIRSLGFVVPILAILWLWYKEKLSVWLSIAAIGLLLIVDMWSINIRHISKDSYYKKKDVFTPQMTSADQQILKDTDPHYRVLDLSRGDPFRSAVASNFHHSVGGYHAAKLRRYQDFVEHYLSKNGQLIFNRNPAILDMLNVKYLIGQDGKVTRRPSAYGNAWFVNNINIVDSPDDEIQALANANPRQTAFVLSDYKDELRNIDLANNNGSMTDVLSLASYAPDKLSYNYQASKDRLAVFSEVFYPAEKGWNSYLDGKKMDRGIFPVDYVLRALILPAGKHQLEMRFEPRSYKIGETISWIVSWLILLLLAYAVFARFKITGENALLPVLSETSDNASKTSRPKKTIAKTNVKKAKSRGKKKKS